MGVAHVVTPGSPRPCHQPNRNPLHPHPGDDAGELVLCAIVSKLGSFSQALREDNQIPPNKAYTVVVLDLTKLGPLFKNCLRGAFGLGWKQARL